MSEPMVLLGALGYARVAAVARGRLWSCNWIDRQIAAVDMDGTAEMMLTRDPDSFQWGI